MVQSFRIETLDRSGRWYLAPGTRSIYDLRVRNDSQSATECTLVIEDPPSGVTVDPSSFTLRGYEVRTITVTFSENVNPARAGRILVSLRDASGGELSSFEHPLVLTGGTDCSIALTFKESILVGGELRGFVMQCAVRSQSEAPSAFPILFAPHPAFALPPLPALQLEPGQSGQLDIPVVWNRSVKDSAGSNHPAMLEASVPVSNGRRISRIRWELIEAKLQQPSLKDPANRVPSSIVAPASSPAASQASAPVAVAEKPHVPLNGQNGLKCLPNPTPRERAPWNGSAPSAPIQAVPTIAAAAAISPPAQGVELSLFPGLVETGSAGAPPAQSSPGTAAPKLTPYTPAKFDAANEAGIAVRAPMAPTRTPQAQPAPAPAPQPLLPPTTTVVRARHVVTPALVRRSLPSGMLIGGLAVAAVALAAILLKPAAMLRPPTSTQPIALVSPLAANIAAPIEPPQPAAHKPAALAHAKTKLVAATPKQTQTPQPASTATPQAPTPHPATPRPSATTAATKPAVHRNAARPAAGPVSRQQHLYQPESGPVVALGGIAAYYGPRGRVVRVLWSAAEQASASVQLIDQHGATVSATRVRGSRQSAILYLPRRFHGPLTIQVSSVGRLGERVAQTTSLAAY